MLCTGKGVYWMLKHGLNKTCLKRACKSILQEVMRSSGGEPFWNRSYEERPKAFVEFFQVPVYETVCHLNVAS